MVIIQKVDTNQCVEGLEKTGPSHVAGENVKWYR